MTRRMRVHFRHRIGVEGVEKILAVSILMHGKAVLNEDISIDTTAQPKNITYPTDTKLAVKIIKQCRQIAGQEAVELRQSYKASGNGFVKKSELEKSKASQSEEASTQEVENHRQSVSAGIETENEGGKFSQTA